MLRVGFWLLASVVVVSYVAPAYAADSTALVHARAALKNLGYSEARPLLEEALKQGGHTREELLEIYALRGETSAVLDGAEASETEFRKLLILDPTHSPPARESPTFRVPFDNARKWAANAGKLRVDHQAKIVSPESFDLIEQIVSDPLAMAASVEVDYRAADDGPYTKILTPAWHQTIPLPLASARYEISILDRWGNVLVRSSANEPTPPVVAAPVTPPSTDSALVASPPQPRRWYASPAGWAFFGTGAVAVIAGGALLGEATAEARTARSATMRSDYLTAQGRTTSFEASGAAAIAIGGVLAIAGTAVLIYRATHHR